MPPLTGKKKKEIDEIDEIDFVKKYLPFAQQTERENGISAIAILAQAAVESSWGTKAPGNNFFGIKADKSWKGEKQILETKEFYKNKLSNKFIKTHHIHINYSSPDEKRKGFIYDINDTFRKYHTPKEGFSDHTSFFVNNPRYKNALAVKKDPFAFADAVALAGYATDKDYAKTLKATEHTIEKVIKHLAEDSDLNEPQKAALDAPNKLREGNTGTRDIKKSWLAPMQSNMQPWTIESFLFRPPTVIHHAPVTKPRQSNTLEQPLSLSGIAIIHEPNYLPYPPTIKRNKNEHHISKNIAHTSYIHKNPSTLPDSLLIMPTDMALPKAKWDIKKSIVQNLPKFSDSSSISGNSENWLLNRIRPNKQLKDEVTNESVFLKMRTDSLIAVINQDSYLSKEQKDYEIEKKEFQVRTARLTKEMEDLRTRNKQIDTTKRPPIKPLNPLNKKKTNQKIKKSKHQETNVQEKAMFINTINTNDKVAMNDGEMQHQVEKCLLRIFNS